MSMQEVRNLMSSDYRRYVADIMARHPLQAANRAHYECFEAQAQLGAMTRNVRLKGGGIDKGRVVFYVPDPERADSVSVWWQGCACPALVKKSAVRAL